LATRGEICPLGGMFTPRGELSSVYKNGGPPFSINLGLFSTEIGVCSLTRRTMHLCVQDDQNCRKIIGLPSAAMSRLALE
jgi:hypothetical protein